MKRKNKRILVTGATGGIGIPLCKHLAANGYGLVITARQVKKLKGLAAQIQNASDSKVEIVASDFEKPSSFKNVIAAVGKSLNGLVVMPPQAEPTSNCLPGDKDWTKLFQQSFIGPVGLIRELLPALKKEARSKVVIVSGISSAQVLGHYATSNVLRLAWLAQAKTMAHALGPEGIHFNTLSLGGVLTPEYENELKADAKQNSTTVAKLLEAEVSNVPLRKYATPDEVAVAVEGLLSPFSDHMTGLNILCDGGFTKAY